MTEQKFSDDGRDWEYEFEKLNAEYEYQWSENPPDDLPAFLSDTNIIELLSESAEPSTFDSEEFIRLADWATENVLSEELRYEGYRVGRVASGRASSQRECGTITCPDGSSVRCCRNC